MGWSCEEERGWDSRAGADGSVEGVLCANHVHVCPLPTSAWLEEWRGSRGVVGGGLAQGLG